MEVDSDSFHFEDPRIQKLALIFHWEDPLSWSADEKFFRRGVRGAPSEYLCFPLSAGFRCRVRFSLFKGAMPTPGTMFE